MLYKRSLILPSDVQARNSCEDLSERQKSSFANDVERIKLARQQYHDDDPASPKSIATMHPKRSAIAVVCFMFGVILVTSITLGCWFLSTDIDDSIAIFRPHKDTLREDFTPRIVHLMNDFDHEILAYYDNGENGIFLTNLTPNERIEVTATTGTEMYATEPEGWDRIAKIVIDENREDYHFQPPQTPHAGHPMPISREGVAVEYDVRREERPHPQVSALHAGQSRAVSVRFRSLSSREVDLWFDNGRGGNNQGHLKMGQQKSANAYIGHVFYITDHWNPHRQITRFTIRAEQSLYVIYDDEYPANGAVIEQCRDEEAFMKQYYEKTGLHWRAFYGDRGDAAHTLGPRPPPTLYMWPANEIGIIHQVVSPEGYYYKCAGSKPCQSPEPVTLELELISTRPRVFIINDFLSEHEADLLIDMGKPNLHHSSVGEKTTGIMNTETRTSDNSWVSRSASAMTQSLFLRAADVLQVDESILHPRRAAEDIQVVHYNKGQKYDAHHDWSVSMHPQSRYITLLIYLTDQPSPDAGGETSFPKGNGMQGFKVKPKKGQAVLFYNLLDDGNADDLALHAAMPVKDGEKWLANFWVWDPTRLR